MFSPLPLPPGPYGQLRPELGPEPLGEWGSFTPGPGVKLGWAGGLRSPLVTGVPWLVCVP